MPVLESTNGTHNSRIEAALTTQLTEGYRPTLPVEGIYGPDGMPLYYMRRDIELMLPHPIIHSVLEYYKSGIAGAEFDVQCEDSEVGDFALEQTQRFWDRGVPQLQEGYAYGWQALENVFAEEKGLFRWDCVHHFAPRDTYLLSQKHKPVGVRIKNVAERGIVDLWLASDDVPAKGLWYAHNPRWGQFYGRSQLYGAWRPWRRLAWKDGAEMVMDAGVYRLCYAGPIIRYPEEDYQSKAGVPSTTLDSQGNPRRYARDMARMMAEQFKTGAGIGLPSSKYPADQGGGDKWALELPKTVLNIDPILNYVKVLCDWISYGIGVPPELLEASETGSGYSGRRIPMEAFLDSQQHIADRMLHIFVEQVLTPLIRWNWGPVAFQVKCKRLLETKNKASIGQPVQGERPHEQRTGIIPSPEQMQKQEGFFSLSERIREIAKKAARKVAA
jgi:hypothetical protein